MMSAQTDTEQLQEYQAEQARRNGELKNDDRNTSMAQTYHPGPPAYCQYSWTTQKTGDVIVSGHANRLNTGARHDGTSQAYASNTGDIHVSGDATNLNAGAIASGIASARAHTTGSFKITGEANNSNTGAITSTIDVAVHQTGSIKADRGIENITTGEEDKEPQKVDWSPRN